MRLLRVYLLLVCMTAFSAPLFAQLSPRISRIATPSRVEEGKPLSLSVELVQGTEVRGVFVYYRILGESSFNELEMLRSGRTATATIPAAAVRQPAVEYYVLVRTAEGSDTYPIQNPEGNPLRLSVEQPNPKDQEVRIMSPEPGETIGTDEFTIVISLFYASDAVNRKSTRLFIDGNDVSKEALYADEIITWAPKSLGMMRLGAHTIKVELRDTLGKAYHTVQSSFNLSTVFALDEEKNRFRMGFSGQAEWRNESIDTTTTTYARLDLRGAGTYSVMNFGFNLHLDNQEKESLQPQNRYLLYGETSWLRVQLGDAYPQFPAYIMSGKRVRGVSGNLALGFFNVDVTYGKTERKIEGYVTGDSISSVPLENAIKKNDSTYTLYSPGMYDRKFFAIRPSFGSGENFQLGFTYMKAIDDTNSIKYGQEAKENLVVGSDLTLAFDEDRFRWESQVSLSIRNDDIRGGSFTQAQYDSLKANDPEGGKDIEDLGKMADKFITINDKVFPVNPVGSGLPSLAYETALSLNYVNNFVRLVLFRRGAAYYSFGNEYIQTDVGGYQISDRIRMFSNKVFLSVSYEHKADNTADTKDYTTTYSNLTTSLNLNLGQRFPSLIFGYGVLGRSADKNLVQLQPDSITYLEKKVADEATNRIFFASSYDFVAGIRHTANVSVSYLGKDDKSFYGNDQRNGSYQAAITSYFTIPLQTTVSVLVSSNESDQQPLSVLMNPSKDTVGMNAGPVTTTKFNYTSLSFAGQYRMMEDRLRLMAVFSPTFGDFKRNAFTLAGDYEIWQGHHLEARMDFVANQVTVNQVNNVGIVTGTTTRNTSDFIASLLYRFDF